jgi:uncharacterized protein YndB with AHSA1/START domain
MFTDFVRVGGGRRAPRRVFALVQGEGGRAGFWREAVGNEGRASHVRLAFVRAHHVTVDRIFAKPPGRVFAYLAEHENLADLFGAKITRLKDGDDGRRNGVGSVRSLRIGPLPPFEETVTEYEEPRRIVYRITRGSPLRGHVGVMTFEPEGEGTRFHYDIRLASPVPGLAALVRASLTRTVEANLHRVERDA